MQALSQGMGWSRKVRQQPGLTPGFSLPPQLPEPAGGRQGPNLCGGKCISLTETGQALGWVPGGRGSVLRDTDVPPSSPRSSRVKAVGLAGRAGLAEEVGWSESPESLLRPLSETLLPDSGGGGSAAVAVPLLLGFLGFLQDRQGDGPWGEEAGTPPC